MSPPAGRPCRRRRRLRRRRCIVALVVVARRRLRASRSTGLRRRRRSRSSSSRRDKLGEGRLVVDASAPARRVRPRAFLLDPRARAASSPASAALGGASPVSRSRAISPTAVASGTSSAVRARVIASPRTRASAAGRDWRERRPSPARRAPRPAPSRAHRTPPALRCPAAPCERAARRRDGAAAAPANRPRRALRRPAAARAPGPGDGTRAVLPDAGRDFGGEHDIGFGVAWRSPASRRPARGGTGRCESAGSRRLARLPDHAFGQVLAEHALVIFGDQRPLGSRRIC